jgi:hypothetical protein
MSDTPKKGAASTEKPRTPHQDALDAKPQREAAEKQAKEAHSELEEAGLLVEPTAITGYEHERAKLGGEPEPSDEPEPEVATPEK